MTPVLCQLLHVNYLIETSQQPYRIGPVLNWLGNFSEVACLVRESSYMKTHYDLF